MPTVPLPLQAGDWSYLNEYLAVNAGQVFSVKDTSYAGGAKGTGLVADNVAIQAAIDACNAAGGGTVYFPPGTYLLSAQLNIKTNVRLMGAGKTASILKVADNAGVAAIGASGAQNDVTVEQLGIDGNKANQVNVNSYGIAITSSNRVTVKYCRIVNTYSRGIYCWGNTDSVFAFNEVEGMGAAGAALGSIDVVNSIRTRVIGNRVDGGGVGHCIGGTGIGDVFGLVIMGNVCKDPGGNQIGIALGVSNQHIAVVGNHVNVASTTAHCIDTGSCIDVTVTGNTITGGKTGISTDTGQRRTITANAIRATAGSGIDVTTATSAKDFVISGNMISNCGFSGISVDGATNGLIVGNFIKNCSQSVAGTFNGIELRSTSQTTTDVLVTGNRCYDDQGGKTQGYGVRSYGSTDNISVVGNDLRGNLTGTVTLVGTANNIGKNIGVWVDGTKALSYSASIATDASTGTVFPIVATNGTAFTIANPTNLQTGMTLTYDIKNSSGGAHGVITWGATFLNGGAGTVGTGAFAGIANTKRRTISFYYDGTNLVELSRSVDL